MLKKMIVSDESTSCLFATRPHICEEVSSRRIQVGVLDLTVKHLLKVMIWCCMTYGEVGHCQWNCQCDQMHRYTAEVHGAISIALFQYPFCLKDDSEPCHCAKLVTN